MWHATFERILRQHLALPTDDSLEQGAELSDYGLDSMSTVAILVDLEEHFNVTFTDETLAWETFATAGALWAAVEELLMEAN